MTFRNTCRHTIILMLLPLSLLIPGIPAPDKAMAQNAISYNAKGWEYLNKGNSLKAILNFKQALKQNSRYNEAIIGLAQSYLHTEAYEEALKLFDSSLKIDGNNSSALVGMGFSLTGLGNYNEALRHFEDALKKSGENTEAHYGIADIYFKMGKHLWAKRKINAILRINPYHYNSLMLLARIKSGEKRFDEAKSLVEKAIDAQPDNNTGYTRIGELYLDEYLTTGNEGHLSDAINEFNKAIARDPGDFSANTYMGYISMLKKEYQTAIQYFEKNNELYGSNIIPLYNLSIAHDATNDIDKSMMYFTKALKKFRYDSVLRARFDDFLIARDIKSGNPLRVDAANEYLTIARNRMKNNLTDQAILYLRRSIMLNPLMRDSREYLRDYYHANNYYTMYLQELKDLLRLYPEHGYQEMLTTAVYKSRKKLFSRLGYSDEPPVRDVPNVLVLDFNPVGALSPHMDSGRVIANYISFAMQQFGRLRPVGIGARSDISEINTGGIDYVERILERIHEKKDYRDTVDYIVYGNSLENSNHISVRFNILDNKTGIIIGEFELSESGHESLPNLALRVARRLYDHIPYRGRILKVEDDRVVLNLGLYDGLEKGDMVVAYRINKKLSGDSINRKMVFSLDRLDTVVSTAKPLNNEDLQVIEIDDMIFPLNKRRARMIN